MWLLLVFHLWIIGVALGALRKPPVEERDPLICTMTGRDARIPYGDALNAAFHILDDT